MILSFSVVQIMCICVLKSSILFLLSSDTLIELLLIMIKSI